MPFRIPSCLNSISCSSYDAKIGELEEYVEWLRCELATARALLDAKQKAAFTTPPANPLTAAPVPSTPRQPSPKPRPAPAAK